MFVDASAIVALLSDEPEAERVSEAIAGAPKRMTSPVAVLEAALALARPDKFAMTVEAVQPIVLEFMETRGIDIRDLPPAKRTTALALSAAHRYRAGRRGLNLGDCLHYAAEKYYRVPILASAEPLRIRQRRTAPPRTGSSRRPRSPRRPACEDHGKEVLPSDAGLPSSQHLESQTQNRRNPKADSIHH